MASPSPSSEEIAKEKPPKLCYKRIHIDAGTDTVKLWRIVEDDSPAILILPLIFYCWPVACNKMLCCCLFSFASVLNLCFPAYL